VVCSVESVGVRGVPKESSVRNFLLQWLPFECGNAFGKAVTGPLG
jgi:hypothetical protein